MGDVFLTTKDLTKKFGDVKAVNNVSMEVRLGEIKGLIGENGSGKSTITQMISGIYSITSGEIYIQGERYKPNSINDAREHKIAMIVQEVGTIPSLSISDNLFLGDEARFKKGIILDKKKIKEEAKKALALVGFNDVDPDLPCGSLNMEHRKMLEIARALYYEPSLFIIDETTTALSQDGREMIYKIMHRLKEENKAVLFISHDLPELMEHCDCLTVLRDGELVANIDKKDFSDEKIKSTMVGREIKGHYYREDFDPSHSDEVLLKANHISSKDGSLVDISLELHAGEILGIGGLSDSGMHDLGKALFGMKKLKEGEIVAKTIRPLTKKEKRELHRTRLHNQAALDRNRMKNLFKKNYMQGGKKNQASEALTMESIENYRRGFVPEGVTLKKFEYPKETIEHKITSIADAFDCSIGYIAKNRDEETLILPENIRDNICISAYELLNIYGFITPSMEKRFTQQQIDFLRIKCAGQNQIVSELSGGNKQKISFAKWIGNNSKILVFDSPTRGVDIGVKTTMYQLLDLLKKAGYAILIISEEMQELIGMADNIMVMKDGHITKTFVRSESLTDVEIIHYMI